MSLAALLLLVATACRSDKVFTSMSDSTFVHVMIELRTLPVGVTGDASGRALQRDSILRQFGVTGPDMESTAVRLARNPQQAAEIWRAIEATAFTPP